MHGEGVSDKNFLLGRLAKGRRTCTLSADFSFWPRSHCLPDSRRSWTGDHG